jgi:ATP-dependent DNA helicase RecQ
MEGYALTRQCRRAYVLRYFGDRSASRCDGCDVCLPVSGTLVPGIAAPRPLRTFGGIRTWTRSLCGRL